MRSGPGSPESGTAAADNCDIDLNHISRISTQ
jgi:hypothetical protein